MKTTLFFAALFAVLVPIACLADDQSPIISAAISADSGPAAVAAAKQRGAASATRDIQTGTLRILYYGPPWSLGKPLIDASTGYRVQVLDGCVATEPFTAEVAAYNDTVRDFHTKHPSPEQPTR